MAWSAIPERLYMKRVIGLIVSSSLIFWLPEASFAHGGGVDSSGCHNDRSTGMKHCHGAGSSLGDFSIGKSKKKKKRSKRRR
jgi:hypothetical protein